MIQETKNCQNCKNEFVIEPDDFAFYEKINVPPPTFCPECRMIRRFLWRNDRHFFKRKCDAPGHTEDIITIYSPEETIVVYDRDFWFSDGWDALVYGRNYNFQKPFFSQFQALIESVPFPALFDSKSTNSNYCNFTVEHKNSYFVTEGWNNEDSCYSSRISFCKDTFDSYICHKTEFSYGNVYCRESYQLFFSRDSESCNNSYFLYDCKNCSYCIGCTNLRNKQYYIFNEPYTKEEYFKKLKEIDLASAKAIDKLQKKFNEACLSAIHKYARLTNTTNVIGDSIENSRNCYYCFDLAGEAENSKYSHWGTYGLKDSYDTGPGTGGTSELLYEGVSIGVKNARCKFGTLIWYSHDVQYSFNCHDSAYLFGCVGLRNKQYCILNKQYSKEEYEELVPRIIEQMNAVPYQDKIGRIYKYGEYFPPEISPFAYAETITPDYVSFLEREEVIERGYKYREPVTRSYIVTKNPNDLPDSIKGIDEEILNEVIGCVHEGKCNEQCTTAFKIIPQELQFYQKMNLPLPRLCPNCRHYERLKQRNPLKLWHRQCMCNMADDKGQMTNDRYTNTAKHFHGNDPCPNEFETSYFPDRKEIVYCEACYNAEVL